MSTSIPIEISARHIHCDQETWTKLFGEDRMTSGRDLSQHTQFVATQRATLVGPHGEIENVGIVGPLRPYSQVELAASDARRLGVPAPVSDSGNLEHAAEITIQGAAGAAILKAAIIQQRHIHAAPDEAEKLGLANRQMVSVRVEGQRGGVFENVLVRVHDDYHLSMHIDTDEANAFGITPGDHGTIVG